MPLERPRSVPPDAQTGENNGDLALNTYLINDAYGRPSTKCVDSTAKNQPTINLQCFQDTILGAEEQRAKRETEELERRMNSAIKSAGTVISTAIEKGKGRHPIEIAKLSDNTNTQLWLKRNTDTPGYSLLKPQERMVFDYLISQGLQPYLAPPKKGEFAYSITIRLFRD